MFVDFSQALKDETGKNISDPIEFNRATGQVTKSEDLTLGKLSRFVLKAEDKEAKTDDFLKKCDFAKKIYDAENNDEDLEISIDEAKMIKDMVFKNNKNPIYYWSVNSVLESASSVAVQAAKIPKKKKTA